MWLGAIIKLIIYNKKIKKFILTLPLGQCVDLDVLQIERVSQDAEYPSYKEPNEKI